MYTIPLTGRLEVPFPAQTPHPQGESLLLQKWSVKDYNPYLEKLRKEFLSNDEFIRKFKQHMEQDAVAANHKTPQPQPLFKPPSFLQSQGLLLTPSIPFTNNSHGATNASKGGHMASLGVQDNFALARPKSFAGRQKSLKIGDGTFEGILSRVKTLDPQPQSSPSGGGGGRLKSKANLGENTNSHFATGHDTAMPSIEFILDAAAVQVQDTRVVLEKVDYEAVIAQSEMQLCALEDDECMDSIKGFLEDVGIAVAGEREKENAKEKKEDDSIKKKDPVKIKIKFAADDVDDEDDDDEKQNEEDSSENIDNPHGIKIMEQSSSIDSLRNLDVRPPRMALLKKKTVMNTWTSNQKTIIKKPSTFMDIMKETKEKYQTAGKLGAAAKISSVNPTPHVSITEKSFRGDRNNSIVGLPATVRQFVDPTVYQVEKQMESWKALVKQMYKRRGKGERSKNKRKGKFHDPVQIVIMLSTLGISPNLLNRVEIDTLRIILAIKLWKKRAVESRTHRSMPIRKLTLIQDKELLRSLPPPIRGQINEFAVVVLQICVRRYAKLIGPTHVKTLKASKRLAEMEKSIMPEFGFDCGDVVSIGQSTVAELPPWYRFLRLFQTRNPEFEDEGEASNSDSVSKLLVSTMSIGALKKVYPIEEEEDIQNDFTRDGRLGGGVDVGGIQNGAGGKRIFPIDEDED